MNFFFILLVALGCVYLIDVPHLTAQRSDSIVLGFKEYVPQLAPNNVTALNSNSRQDFFIHQAALWKKDTVPFPWWFTMLFVEYLVDYDKWSFGGGYQYANDFHNIQSDKLAAKNISANFMNHYLYGTVLWHLKHRYAFTPYAGIKAGLHLYQAGLSQHLPDAANNNGRFHARIPYTLFAPGIFTAFTVGIKMYLYPKLVGFKVHLDYSLTTPTWSLTKANINTTNGTIISIDSRNNFFLNASGFKMGVSFFTHLPPLFQ